MNLDARIYVAGHTGMVGSAIWRRLQQQGYHHLIGRTHQELDLTHQQSVNDFFQQTQPEYVFLAAAKVGGIYANHTYPAQFIYQNLLINTHIIHAAYQHRVKRLLFLGSSCIYPRDSAQPIQESAWLSGRLEDTNRPYAIAKIAGAEMCWAYYREYGCPFLSVMPTNLYGPGDHYDLYHSHVIPALLMKFHLAKIEQQAEVTLWGTGQPYREFLYCEDAADACIFLMNLNNVDYLSFFTDKEPPIVNLGCGQDLMIRDLAEMIKSVVGYSGKILWDESKPDGTPRKLLDSSKIQQLGWNARTPLLEGLRKTYEQKNLICS